MPSMARNAIVTDLNRCIGCFACELACKQHNNVDLGIKWMDLLVMGPYGTFPDIQQYWLPKNCQQCENAPCIDVCPTGASYRNEDGVVLVDAETCIGCETCIPACPYGVRTLNPRNQIVEKCTMCSDLVAQGKVPACVSACCADARFFGDLDDPESDASKALAAADEADVHTLPDNGNAPLNRYILSERIAPWLEELPTA